jgi:hypothetical protein
LKRFDVKQIILNDTDGSQKGQFSLIHIPLHLYAAFFQPILQVLLPQEGLSHLSEFEDILEGFSIDGKHGFLNISVTPLECSIVCHTTWVQNVFARVIALLPKESSKQIQISKDAYNVFAVISAGIEEGKRVMDVTAPLAIAGVPIFFIPTYCTDFILAPSKDRHTVAQVLLAYGFEFSENDSVYLTPSTLHSKLRSAGIDAPLTPPPSDVAGLQSRAFSQLKKGRMNPFTEPSLHLVQCSGKKMTYEDDSLQFPIPIDTIDSKLYIGLISALAQQPRFLSVTLSSVDAPSLLIDKYLLGLFGDSIAGGTETDLVPIFFDLHDLPLESSGIVCGVPSKLVDEMRRHDRAANPDWELTYLSTARAGAVILSAEALAMALDVLMPLF